MERMEDDKVLISALFTVCCLVCCLSLSSTYKLGACCNLVHLTFVHLMNKYAALFLTCILISPKWMRTNLSSTCLVCSVNVYEPQDGISVFFLPGKDCRWEPRAFTGRDWLLTVAGWWQAATRLSPASLLVFACSEGSDREGKKQRDRKKDKTPHAFCHQFEFYRRLLLRSGTF